MKVLFLLLAALLAGGKLTSEVNPFVGTSDYGATNPGAVCPNGMMSVSPFNVSGSVQNRWDKDSQWWSTPYSADNLYFTGFSHVNLSGVGCPELGSVLTMATAGKLEVDYTRYGSFVTGEDASPGYYTATYSKYGIKAEASATMRSSIERYTFPAGQANLIVNLGEALTNEQGGWIRRISPTEIEGMRLCGGFGYTNQAVFPLYFCIRVSKAPKATGFFKKQPPMTAEAAWDSDAGKYKIYNKSGREIAGDDLGAWFSWDAAEGERICVQTAVSFVDCEGAWRNLSSEQGEPDFDAVRNAADAAWEEALGRIRVEGGTPEQKKIFYTALYHALLHPNILDDADGRYPLMESGYSLDPAAARTGRVEKGQHRYTVFSLWDTYRNVHQLLTLVYPEKQADMLRSMVDMYKESGWMPKWELYGRETYIMEGDPAIPVIVDSYLKGLRDFDVAAAWEAFVKSAETPANPLRPDNVPYNEKGYIPLGLYSADFSGDNSVSHALEYYVADAALARFAEALASDDPSRAGEYLAAAERYRARSLGYRHYYSTESGTLRPLNADGDFLEPFDPRQGENFEAVPGFHEGSAWNYTFYVPHDIPGLAKLMGGPKAFCARLQRVFDEGLYDPANEPDIAYPYLFSRFKGEEWRTQKIVDELLAKYYTLQPDGLPGNDDTGTMSAWAVFSMMGLYPDCPGDPSYTITTPAFDRVEIRLPGAAADLLCGIVAKAVCVEVAGAADRTVLLISRKGSGRTIRRIRAGGKTQRSFRISHEALLDAGTLEIVAGT